MTVRQWRSELEQALAGSEAFRRTADLLLCKALGVDRLELIKRPDAPVRPEREETLRGLLARRLAGEPVAYILGEREFYGRPFVVSPATLIPRPETEHLVEEALGRLPETALWFADLGTGSGCLAVTLAAERPAWRGVAVDISEDALAVARINAEALGVADRLIFLRADFSEQGFVDTLAGFPASTSTAPAFPASGGAPGPLGAGREPAAPEAFGGACGPYTLVVSNPPYVSDAEYAALDSSVREYEPRQALACDREGMALPAAVVDAAWRVLAAGGLLLMEHGAGQGAAARELCPPERWKDVTTGKDLAGLERYLSGARR